MIAAELTEEIANAINHECLVESELGAIQVPRLGDDPISEAGKRILMQELVKQGRIHQTPRGCLAHRAGDAETMRTGCAERVYDIRGPAVLILAELFACEVSAHPKTGWYVAWDTLDRCMSEASLLKARRAIGKALVQLKRHGFVEFLDFDPDWIRYELRSENEWQLEPQKPRKRTKKAQR
jgi:hypothetical protein